MSTLLPISVLLGVCMLWVFRAVSNQKAIQRAKARIMACLYEMLLFGDEPSLVIRAQIGLIAANVRYLALMLAPAAVLAVPMLALYANFQAMYGVRPLQPGEQALVVLQMRDEVDMRGRPPMLKAPPGVVVETPAVRIPSKRQMSWRIKAERASSGLLSVALPGGDVTKRLEASTGAWYLASRRVSSIASLLWRPGESLIFNRDVDWIEVRYPHTEVRWLGFEMHWASWLLIFSMLSALIFKRRLKVAF